jgi:CubicO group peptidase (beta-lactamase class C family)
VRAGQRVRCRPKEQAVAQGRSIFPAARWVRRAPREAGFDPAALAEAGRWLEQVAGGRAYRVAVVRGGAVVAEWNGGMAADERIPLASAAKSVYSCMLAVAVAEGRIGSPDDRVVEYYPQMMDVPEGFGPKDGRFAREKDREITFRQLISNTSGYLKPPERPGEVFHYQTFGMNVLCHAIATAYGCYDSSDPPRLGGFGKLIEARIRDPIGAAWTWDYTNFDLQPKARLNIFGNYTQLHATALDCARLGLLWLNGGRWDGRQVVPEGWLREATQVAPEVRRGAPPEQWSYGYGFWTNELGRLWPDLPGDCFAALGAGSKLICVCPSLDLVVVECPGIYREHADENDGLARGPGGLLRRVIDSAA